MGGKQKRGKEKRWKWGGERRKKEEEREEKRGGREEESHKRDVGNAAESVVERGCP